MEAPVSLPAELHDLILDNLCGEHDTLKACAVVCKRWLPRAQSLIFSRIHLDDTSTECFHSHVAQYPQLCGYVRELTVSGTLDGATLAGILQKLRSLTTLDLSENLYVPWGYLVASAPWMGDILVAILSMPNLHTLRCHAVFSTDFRSQDTNADYHSSITDLRKLHSLDISSGNGYSFGNRVMTSLLREAILTKLGSTSAGPSLLRRVRAVIRCRDWVFVGDDEPEVTGINLLLDTIGQQLEELSLGLYTWESDPIHETLRIHLSQCGNLRTVELGLRWFYDHAYQLEDDNYHAQAFRMAATIISSLPRTAPIEHVIVTLREDFGTQCPPQVPVRSARDADSLRDFEDKLCTCLPHLGAFTLRASDSKSNSLYSWVAGKMERLRGLEGLSFNSQGSEGAE